MTLSNIDKRLSMNKLLSNTIPCCHPIRHIKSIGGVRWCSDCGAVSENVKWKTPEIIKELEKRVKVMKDPWGEDD